VPRREWFTWRAWSWDLENSKGLNDLMPFKHVEKDEDELLLFCLLPPHVTPGWFTVQAHMFRWTVGLLLEMKERTK